MNEAKVAAAKADLEEGFFKLLIPEHLQGGIERYVLYGTRPGHFLCAVIDNDLREAVARADEEALAALRPICQLLYNFAPGGNHGSLANRQAWQEKGGVNGGPPGET